MWSRCQPLSINGRPFSFIKVYWALENVGINAVRQMFREDHFRLFDQLRFGKDPEERRTALQDLKDLEDSFETTDLVGLLKDDSIVLQKYAIEALGRIGDQQSFTQLEELFRRSTDPIILTSLLKAFTTIKDPFFVKVVVGKFKKPFWQRKKKKDKKQFNRDFLVDHILLDVLKYLQTSGTVEDGKKILPYLNHHDKNIRRQVLVTLDQLKVPIDENELSRIRQSDYDVLVKEQVSIMLEKKKRGR